MGSGSSVASDPLAAPVVRAGPRPPRRCIPHWSAQYGQCVATPSTEPTASDTLFTIRTCSRHDTLRIASRGHWVDPVPEQDVRHALLSTGPEFRLRKGCPRRSDEVEWRPDGGKQSRPLYER